MCERESERERERERQGESEMEDCCAVCAEPLEWVAYGACNHREVCSTCVTRLRFVLKDKKCCICKQECDSVFVTKALGDFTKPAGDFSTLPKRLVQLGGEGIWYDPIVGAYFDDEDHFKSIRAMTRLSCSICDSGEADSTQKESPSSMPRSFLPKDFVFQSIPSLKKHYSSSHKLSMCDLCLEGRKVFISEQKLYTRAQLDRHSASGNLEVDGTDEERGGFKGHPMCQFCKKRFYGDNELYHHMIQEHFTCFLCQRARPGSYEYFSNYSDLEEHFRGEHFLCEDQECLDKKFVVFISEQDFKRHNVQNHGGNMSRAERNRQLQIPATQLFNFSSRRGTQENGGGGGFESGRRNLRGRQPGGPGVLLAPHPETVEATMRASVETAVFENALRESAALAENPEAQRARANRLEAERRSRQDQVSIQERNSTSVSSVEAFPSLSRQDGTPLSASGDFLSTTGHRGRTSQLQEEYFPPLPANLKNAKRKGKVKGQVSNASMASLLGGGNSLSAIGGRGIGGHSGHSPSGISGSWSSPGGSSRPPQNFPPPISSIIPVPPSGGSRTPSGGGEMRNGREGGEGSEEGGGKVIPPELSMDELRAANKALVEKIRQGLDGNEEQFAAFKEISGRFRRGELTSVSYYFEIARLGLSYVVPELARLCPDPRKKQELLDAHMRGVLKAPPEKIDKTGIEKGNGFCGNRGEGSVSSVNAQKRSGGSSNPRQLVSSKTETSQVPSGKSVGKKGKAVVGESSNPNNDISGNPMMAAAMSSEGYRKTNTGKAPVVVAEESSSSGFGEINPHSSHNGIRESVSAPNLLAQRFQGTVSINPPLSTEERFGNGILGSGSKGSFSTLNEGESWTCDVCTLLNSFGDRCDACGSARPGGSQKTGTEVSEEGGGGETSSGAADKKKKKVAKFQRLRLGDASSAHFFTTEARPPSRPDPWGTNSNNNNAPPLGMPTRGAWKNSGGQRLVGLVQRDDVISSAWARPK